MAHSRQSDPEYRNWATVGRAIQITRNGLETIIQNAADKYHTSLLTTLPNNVPAWKSHLSNAHRSTHKRKISLSNSDDTQWLTAGASWEIAKIFMAPLGPRKLDVVNAKTTDISGLLNVLEWSPRGTNGMFNTGVDLLKIANARSARNLWAHAPSLHVSDADKIDAFASFTSLLRDPELNGDKDVQVAINELSSLLDTGRLVIEEKELELFGELRRQLGQDIISLESDMSCWKDEVGANLEQSKDQMKGLDEFVKKNELQDILKTIEKRINDLEDSSNSTNSRLENIKKESPESWKWEKSSIIHREMFIKLFEYGQEHPKEIRDINGVRVCFSQQFRIGKGSDATRVFIGLGKDGYEKAVKRLLRDDCACLAEQEKKILNDLNTTESNYVVKYRGYLDDKTDEEWVFLIMDLCEETLKEFVERSSLDGWVTIAQNIIQQVLKGLADLHRDPNPVLHRDLKPSNILRNVHGKWLLADFGISRILTQGLSTFRSKERGTKHWRAVESCSTNDMSDDDVRYKKKSDIQVAGMVAFYIVTKGQHPFGEEADQQRNLLDGNPVYLDKLEDPAAKDLISWMLSHYPEDRPSAQEALKHPYLQSKKQQFEMLCKVGNQQEIKIGDTESDVVRLLNSDPEDWRSLMNDDVLKYLSTDSLKVRTFQYKPSWTDCLRLIRNVKEHWHDRPRPRPELPHSMGDPQEYFLNLFPNLPVMVHGIIRSCDWKERPDLKEYF